MTVREEVKKMKPLFPRITVAAISAANHPHESGVTFTKRYIEARGEKRPDRRSAKKAVRFTVRMSDGEQRRVKQVMEVLNYDTVQDCIHYMVFHIAIPAIAKEKAAADAGTSTSGKENYDMTSIDRKGGGVNGV